MSHIHTWSLCASVCRPSAWDYECRINELLITRTLQSSFGRHQNCCWDSLYLAQHKNFKCLNYNEFQFSDFIVSTQSSREGERALHMHAFSQFQSLWLTAIAMSTSITMSRVEHIFETNWLMWMRIFSFSVYLVFSPLYCVVLCVRSASATKFHHSENSKWM